MCHPRPVQPSTAVADLHTPPVVIEVRASLLPLHGYKLTAARHTMAQRPCAVTAVVPHCAAAELSEHAPCPLHPCQSSALHPRLHRTLLPWGGAATLLLPARQARAASSFYLLQLPKWHLNISQGNARHRTASQSASRHKGMRRAHFLVFGSQLKTARLAPQAQQC